MKKIIIDRDEFRGRGRIPKSEMERRDKYMKSMKKKEIIGSIVCDNSKFGIIIFKEDVDNEFDIDFLNSLETYAERREYYNKHKLNN